MNLSELTKKANVTDLVLAKRLGVANSTISQWRRGRYLPRADYIPKICAVLNCSADDLFGLPESQRSKALSRSLAVDLYKAITKNGAYNAELLHQMATAFRRANNNKLTEFEKWLREIAEAVYKVELSKSPNKKKDLQDVMQLSLF